MNVFEAVKQSVTARQAAEHYGLRVRPNGMAVCPFHPDRTPSLKVDERFHCFGCGADGDVIDFAARLYGLDGKAAAQKLAADFNLAWDGKAQKPRPRQPVMTKAQRYQLLEKRCVQSLENYLKFLRLWEVDFAPSPEDESWHPLFSEALREKPNVDFLLDALLSQPLDERAALLCQYGKEIQKIERRLSDLIA